nr:Rep family protein [Enterococcus sp. BWR-S5]
MISDKDCAAYCFHDKDTLSDGMPKGLHCHILLMFANARYQRAIMKALSITREENCEPVRAKSSVARYLTHRTSQAMDDGKYPYNADEVICINCEYRELIKQTSEKKQELIDIDEFIGECSQDIRAGKYWEDVRDLLKQNFGISKGEKLWKKYRKDFEIDFHEYLSIKAREYSKYGRPLVTIFITANESGVGKSQLAKAISYHITDRVHFVPAKGKGKTFDFAGLYKGELVSVFNEVGGSEFGNKAFNEIFDPYQYSAINSRGKDKHWLALYAILTTTESREQFIMNAMPCIDERYQNRALKRQEINRRLPYEIICTGLGDNKAQYELRKLCDEKTMETVGTVYCNDVRDMEKMTKTALNALIMLGLKENDQTEEDYDFLEEKITYTED